MSIVIYLPPYFAFLIHAFVFLDAFIVLYFFSAFLATPPESKSTSIRASQLDRKVRCEQKETNSYGDTATHWETTVITSIQVR